MVSEYLINLDLLFRFHYLKVFAFGFLDSYILSYEAILFLVQIIFFTFQIYRNYFIN